MKLFKPFCVFFVKKAPHRTPFCPLPAFSAQNAPVTFLFQAKISFTPCFFSPFFPFLTPFVGIDFFAKKPCNPALLVL